MVYGLLMFWFGNMIFLGSLKRWCCILLVLCMILFEGCRNIVDFLVVVYGLWLYEVMCFCIVWVRLIVERLGCDCRYEGGCYMKVVFF